MGYYVTGVDVFIWILLTAGAIVIPIIVLTICCIRKHFKHEKRLEKLYALYEQKKAGHGHGGIIGPYSSQEIVKKGEKPSLPSIIIQSVATPDVSKNVRFKDDSSKGGGSSITTDKRQNDYTDKKETQQIDRDNQIPTLRHLKDAVDSFVPRPVKPTKPSPTDLDDNRPNRNQVNIQLPLLNLNQYAVNDSNISDQNTSNVSGSIRLPSLVLNQDRQNDDVVYSDIHYPGQQHQQQPRIPSGSYSSANNSFFNEPVQTQVSVPARVSASIENIYSHVLPNRNRDRVQQVQNDEQPLYMNTQYRIDDDNRLPGMGISIQTNSNMRPPRPQNDDWNDSSI